MSDVGKVEGGKGPEPTGPKRKKKHDTEAFKEMMKVGKVRETDPEEKRKRKRQAEAEEDFKAEQGVPAPHQGLEAEPKEPSPYEPKAGTEADFGPGAPTQQRGPETPPSSYPQPQEEPQQPPQAPQERRKPEQKEPSPPKATEKKEPAPKKGKKEKAAGPVPHAKKPAITTPPPKIKETAEIEGGMVPFTPPAPPKEEVKGKKKKEEAEEIIPSTLPKGAWEATKEPEKGKITPPGAEVAPTPTPQLAPGAPPPQAPPPLTAPFAHLPPQVAQLFERMAGVMTVMHESGISQTTINLDNPQFAKSAFYGAQVIITEFSTAPKAFNIELLGNQQAADLFHGNAEELVAAFQAGNYNFKVNRIDTSYLPPSAAVRRKEARRVKRKKSGEG